MQKTTMSYDPLERCYRYGDLAFPDRRRAAQFLKVMGSVKTQTELVEELKTMAIEFTDISTDETTIWFMTTADALEHFAQSGQKDIRVDATGTHLGEYTDAEFRADIEEYNAIYQTTPKELRRGVALAIANTRHAWDAYAQKEGRRQKQMIVDSLKHRPEKRQDGLQELKKLLLALYPRDGELFDLHERALIHMLWQVKRKLTEQEVNDHLVLNLYGYQGAGKSTVLKKIGAPLGCLYVEPKGDKINDSFGGKFHHAHFMANIEEWVNSQKVSAEALKAFITGDFIVEREIRSAAYRRYKQNLTIFSTSNRHLSRIVTDYSGMRRFWEIDTTVIAPGPFDTLNFDTINEIDYLLIWQAINENSMEDSMLTVSSQMEEKFEKTLKGAIRREQEKLRAKNKSEHFLYCRGYYPYARDAKLKYIFLSDLHLEFRKWLKEENETKTYSKLQFQHMIEEIRGISIIIKGRNTVMIGINRDPDIDGDNMDDLLDDNNHSPSVPCSELDELLG